MQYTEEQIARANQTDLVSFLNAQGEQLVKSGREYRWKKHDSVTISGNRWYRHSQSKGGYPVDFVMEFYYATFSESDESKGCRRRYRKAYATKGKGKRRNLIRKFDFFYFYSQLYSQHVIIILVGNKSWVKEHTNGY